MKPQKNKLDQGSIFVIKQYVPPTPKQEKRIKELESCIVAIKKELDTIENEADIKMYASMIKEYNNIIYELKNQ